MHSGLQQNTLDYFHFSAAWQQGMRHTLHSLYTEGSPGNEDKRTSSCLVQSSFVSLSFLIF